MNVLAIETSGPIGSVAACRDDELLAEEQLEEGMAHGRLLVTLVDRVVTLAGWDKARDIELIAVSRGPGSFTGLRVGLACAKTLAVMLGRPIVGIYSLDALAQNAPSEFERVLAALDAKRGEVYAAAYERPSGTLVRSRGPQTMKPEDALDLLSGPVCVIGDALAHHADVFNARRCHAAAQDLWRVRAATVAGLGLAAFRDGRRDEPVTLEPVYLRRPEAEEKRLARERGAP